MTLRAPLPADADTLVEFYQTDRAKYVGGPMTERHAWFFFGTEIGHWVMNGFGMFTVTWKGDERPLGIVGHWYPLGWPETEVGWVLFNKADEGQGIAFEAAKACVDHAWNDLRWTEVVSYIDHGNDASVALAKRLGAVLDEDAEIPNKEKDVDVYRHPRPEALV
ncbi:MAG: GNAT family N-acetyltransferase [Boseongicola sp.]|nr:GNAT family N-acetyltransferase [Boseongicola sp.]